MKQRVRSLATRAVEPAVVAGVAACAFVNSWKGVTTGPSYNMWPFWEISYRHGFIRRGLMGTLFGFLSPDQGYEQRRVIVQQLHFAAWVTLIVLIVVAGYRATRGATRRTTSLVFLGVSAVLLSHFIPTIGVTPAYFDVYIILTTLLAASLAQRSKLVPAGLLASVGIVIHDGALFLWLPVLLGAAFELRRGAFVRGERWKLSALALPVIMQIVALAAHDHDALAKCAAELPPDSASVTQFEMPLRDALGMMQQKLSNDARSVALAALFFGWPAAIAVACATALDPAKRRFLWMENTALTLAPCSVLLVAWDLSRFLVWMYVGALITLCRAAWARTRSSTEVVPLTTRARLLGAAGLIAMTAASLGGPVVYCYFERAYADYWFGPPLLTKLPGARVAYGFVEEYNRKQEVRGFASKDACDKLETRNTKMETGCTARVPHDGLVASPILLLAPGRYRAHIRLAASDCEQAIGELEVHPRWRLAPEWQNRKRFDATSTNVVMTDFEVDTELAAMGRMHIEVYGREGCFVVTALDVEALP